MVEWYDRHGIPIYDTAEVERLLRDMSYKRVARSKVISAADPSKSFDVSTVWLGLDHSFGEGIPLIFETKVFAEGDSMDLDCRRYATEQQARGGACRDRGGRGGNPGRPDRDGRRGRRC